MRRVHNGMLAITAALAFAVAGVACDKTARGAREDAAEARVEAEKKAAEAKAESREAAADARRTANEGASAIDAAKQTMDVKTALLADASVDASDINVDTYHESKTVLLKGTVASEAQKIEAGRIAERHAAGYKIDNQLTVKVR